MARRSWPRTRPALGCSGRVIGRASGGTGSHLPTEPTLNHPRRDQAAARALRLGRALAGPALICLAVLIALKAFAFHGLLSRDHPDVLPFWLPTWCHLGTSLASGHLPLWNPAVMGGIPFAADPQSGWLYLPPMLLFSALPCDAAIQVFIVLQPILAGLGLYWFLRSEGCSRQAATVGGLALAMPLCGSIFVLSLPFAGMFAWTPILLACASRYLRSSTRAGRVAWLTLAALSWGQLAGAHLSHGVVLGTGLLVAFLASRLTDDVRQRRRSLRDALVVPGLLIVALPLVNIASLLPRLAYLPQTTLGLGYGRIDTLSMQLGSYSVDRVLTAGLAPSFPLKLVESPGFYMGALALALSFVGFWNRRTRPIAVAVGVYAAICYVLSLEVVVRLPGPAFASSTLGSFYTHFPARLVLGLFFAVPILAAFGVDAWRQSASTRARVLMLAPGVVVWGILAPVLLETPGHHFVLPAVAAVAGGAVLVAVGRWPRAVAVIPLVLAVELIASALSAKRQMFPASAYLRPGPIATYLMQHDGGRYLSVAPGRWGAPGYHVLQHERDWGLMATQRSMVFHLEEAQGYNPAQLVRYWTFNRAIDPKPMRYNAAGFIRAGPVTLDLLQVGYVIQPDTDAPAVPGEVAVAQEGTWILYRLPDPAPRASVMTTWSVVGSSAQALGAVRATGFDPETQVILEGDPHPGITPAPGGAGTASFKWTGDQSARIVVDVSAAAVLVVRNTYATGWRAEVDGRSAPILPADYLVQGIPVTAGHHVVQLFYRDPAIGYGLAGSALVLAGLLAAAGALWRVDRRRSATPPSA